MTNQAKNKAKNIATKQNQKGTAVPKAKPLTEKQQAAIARRKMKAALLLQEKQTQEAHAEYMANSKENRGYARRYNERCKRSSGR
jgi:hypothetical protein